MALLLLLVFLVLFGIISILIALPLLEGRIKPNLFYGFRIRATLENPKVWYAVNKYFAQRLLLAGVVEIIAAVLLFAVPNIDPDTYVLSGLGVFVVAFTIGTMQTTSYLKSISRENNDHVGTPDRKMSG